MAKRKPPVPSPDPDGPLANPRHERFVQEYVAADGNATAAYRRCYPKVTSDAVARAAAARLLATVSLRRRVRALLRQEWRRRQLDADKAVRELQLIAHADPADVFDFTSGGRADGFVALKRPAAIPPQARRAISQITTTPVVVNGRLRHKVSVRFHDKNAALEKLMRACFMYRPLGDLDAFLLTLPPGMRAEFRRQAEAEQRAARREPLAVATSGGPDAPDEAGGADPGAVAVELPDLAEQADGGAVPPASGGVDDLGGLDLSKLFDDP